MNAASKLITDAANGRGRVLPQDLSHVSQLRYSPRMTCTDVIAQKVRTWFNNQKKSINKRNGIEPQRKSTKGKASDGGRTLSQRNAVYDVFRKEIKALALLKLSQKYNGKPSTDAIEAISDITKGDEPSGDAKDPLYRQVRNATTEFIENMTAEQWVKVDDYLSYIEEHGRAVPLGRYVVFIVRYH